MVVAASILAGGIGRRISSPVPKQFLEIQGKPILAHTIEVFLKSSLFQEIVVATHPGWKARVAEMLQRFGWADRVSIVEGGESRQASSGAVLQSLRSRLSDTDLVLIHDAARCLVDPALLARCLAACRTGGAVTAAIPVVDTIARTDQGRIVEFPLRQNLQCVQTPQAFRYGWVLDAHRQALARGTTCATDDARLVMEGGHDVLTVAGSPENIKVSNPQDLALAEILLRKRIGGQTAETDSRPGGVPTWEETDCRFRGI
jgi:2-C-methyl-D-erythritol 4-phosphate cytidylyltransferase